MSETNNLPILRQENVQMIAQSAPDTYNTNALSSQRCADYGEKLLAEIQRGGMTDALDKQCADYIDKSKRTLKAMNERRSPITKLFDQIRSEFTGMENTIDPTKKIRSPTRYSRPATPTQPRSARKPSAHVKRKCAVSNVSRLSTATSRSPKMTTAVSLIISLPKNQRTHQPQSVAHR